MYLVHLGFWGFLLSQLQKIGRAITTTAATAYALDKIDFHHLQTQGIFLKALPFYESGMPLREIARELNVCKTTVRKALLDGGADLHAASSRPMKGNARSLRPHMGVAPFGYCVIKGRITEVPKEQEAIHFILKCKSSGMNLRAIAEHLDRHKVKPRSAKKWDHSIIRSIVIRYQKQTQSEGESHGTR